MHRIRFPLLQSLQIKLEQRGELLHLNWRRCRWWLKLLWLKLVDLVEEVRFIFQVARQVFNQIESLLDRLWARFSLPFLQCNKIEHSLHQCLTLSDNTPWLVSVELFLLKAFDPHWRNIVLADDVAVKISFESTIIRVNIKLRAAHLKG